MHPNFRSKQHGFALVLTLSLMAFILLLLVTIGSLAQVETRSANTSLRQLEAEQAALLGLNIALGELQKAAGPDQRVTATAGILNDNTNLYTGGLTVPDGQASWVGVWKSDTVTNGTASYSPAIPDERKFLAWLVSATDWKGNYQLIAERAPNGNGVDALNSISTDVSSLPLRAGRESHVTLFSKSDGTPYSQVEKVWVNSSDSLVSTNFAFHVEDESVKVDLSWNETPTTGTGGQAQERAQSRRLSSLPGPDYGALNGTNGDGPFGMVTYPLAIDSSSVLEDILKVQSVSDITVQTSDASTASNWLRDSRGDVTWGSRGVLADVKWGGLRRDLSLAFEMDGDKEAVDADNFNAQVGEFVGGSDRFAAPEAARGMNGNIERFLFRDTSSSGSIFSGDIVGSHSVIRGPNWWALRDYANLYKRLSRSGDQYLLKSRAYYPNVAATNDEGYALSAYYGAGSGSYTWDTEMNPYEGYVHRPASASYAPVLLGYTALYSLLSSGGNLALGVDPFFYIWNPYNRTLGIDQYAIRISRFPGHITFWLNKTDGTRQRYGPATIGSFLAKNSGMNDSWRLSYLLSDVTLEPGEVMVVSPGSDRNVAQANFYLDNLFPGTNTDNLSGAILTLMPKVTGTKVDSNGNPKSEEIQWETAPLDATVTDVEYLYSTNYQSKVNVGDINGDGNDDLVLAGLQAGSEHFWVNTYVPDSDIIALDLSNQRKAGDQVQQIGGNVQGDIGTVPEYFDPVRGGGGSALPNPTGSLVAASIVGKQFFGVGAYLAKPSQHEGDAGDTMPNSVEALTLFNPFPVGGYNDMHRPCHLNQVFSAISDPGDVEELLRRTGINFPASDLEAGYWGRSYTDNGSTRVPMIDIPSSPLLSLAAFSSANLTIGTHQPLKAVGNSWASPFVSPVSPYGQLEGFSFHKPKRTASDYSWLLNDALFDRYFLSGIAPDYTIGVSGYNSNSGSLDATLTEFYSDNYQNAQANPVIVPYLPRGVSTSEAVTTLVAPDGYKKISAYALVNGAFNVNSASVAAWKALLQGNRDMVVNFAQGQGADSGSGTPFPHGTSPVGTGNGAASYWSGFSRLSDAQITSLAEQIVEEVKLRGPFMSLSDFVNHRVGTPKNNATHYTGALQAAIEDANINSTVRSSAGGVTPKYGDMTKYMPDVDPDYSNRKTSTGIPTDITQADLLLPLAPRLTVRADTFRIRAYGEAVSGIGSKDTAMAVCEAVIQRVPEYLDTTTDPDNNEAWDEAMDPLSPSASALNALNDQFGRRFKVVSLRWLNANEI